MSSCLAVDNTRVITRAGVIDTAPKSEAEHRRIRLDAATVDSLALLRDAQEASADLLGAWPSPYVATQSDGEPIHPRAFLRRLNRAQDATGLPRVNLHELRHTNITAALRAGLPVHVISRRVGRSKVSTTLDTYARHIPSADDMAAETIGSLLSEPVEWALWAHRARFGHRTGPHCGYPDERVNSG